MMRVPTKSSVIVSLGYLPETETLEIEFQSGAVYQYFHVPPEIYRSFLNAESKGVFLNRFIKTCYSTKRMTSGVVSIAERT